MNSALAPYDPFRSVYDSATEPQIGFSFGGFVKSVGNVAKSVVKSPITKVAAAGLAVVVPPVGVPAAAALVTADRVVNAAEQGSQVGKTIIKNTAKLAKKGDKGAQRGLRTLYVAKILTQRQKQLAAQARVRMTVATRMKASSSFTTAQKRQAAIRAAKAARAAGIARAKKEAAMRAASAAAAASARARVKVGPQGPTTSTTAPVLAAKRAIPAAAKSSVSTGILVLPNGSLKQGTFKAS